MGIISDTTKIDKSFKFVSGKGYTTTQKGVDNEDAASGFIIGTSDVFSQDAGIPNTAPGASTSILTFYGDGTSGNRFVMTYDVSSPLNKAWYASTNGSSLTTMRATRVPNWIPPRYGNYTIRIFLCANTTNTGSYLQEIFFSDATSPLFDYKTGILTFESDPLAAYASIPGGPPTSIQISGYVYSGPLLSQVFDGNGNFTGGLSDFGTSTSLAKFINPNKTFEISSPFAIPTIWATESTPYGSSAKWSAVAQFPNGQGIVVGLISGNPAIAYSWGHGVWRKTTTIPGGIGTLDAVWAGPDDLTAYALDFGTNIIQTTDGGRNWTALSPLSFSGNAIWGSSLTDIFVVGASGNIAHSTNGTVFSAQTNSDSHSLNAVWGSSSTNIYAVGSTGTIRHSVGAGTWTGQTSGTSNNLWAVYGVSASEVYAGGSSGTLLKSTDGSTWSSFNSGIASTFTVDSIWVNSSGGTEKIYASGWDSSANNYQVYVSSGTNSWSIETTFTGPQTQGFYIAGGTSGIFGGLDSGRIAALHKYPIELIHGHARYDGYLNVHGSVNAKNADLNTAIFTTASSTPSIIINPSSTTNYTILSTVTSDTGEGFRFWRESASTYTLDIGSKTTNANDGVTPYAAGGRIRLGGFTTSPSTTSRGEIETVTSSALRINAYQGDLIIQNLFGVNGSTEGDVRVTTQNGAIRLTATGSESPSPSGQILLNPSTSAWVNLTSNTTSTKFQVNSPGGNFNVMYGNGTFQNNGGVTSPTGSFATSVTTPLVQSSGNMNITAGSTSITMFNSAGMNFNLPAGTNTFILWPNSASVSTFRTQGHSGAYNIWDSEGNYQNSGSITSGGNFVTNGSIQANANLLGSLKMQAAIATTGTYHYGMWVTVTGLFGACHVAGWGMGMNPCPANTFYDTQASISARLSGITGSLVYTDHDVLPAKRDSDASFVFFNEFMGMLEWHINNTSGTGFTYGGRVAIY